MYSLCGDQSCFGVLFVVPGQNKKRIVISSSQSTQHQAPAAGPALQPLRNTLSARLMSVRSFIGHIQKHIGVSTGSEGLFSHPATRLAKLPRQKLVLKFADEVVLVLLSLGIIGVNILISHAAFAHKDSSLFAVELSRHASYNPHLHNSLYSTTATANERSGFIAEARADEPLVQTKSAQTHVASSSSAKSSLTSIDESGLSAAVADSIKPLLNEQIKIYTTVAGDTLSSVAARYQIDANTIKWSNNLTSDQLQPGWHLVIPSVKGVLVKTDAVTTIPDIARKFKCSEERIISYNGLDGADSVEPDQFIMCPDGVVSAPERTTATGGTVTRSIGVNYTSIPDLPGVINSFVKGNCTWYVAKKIKITFKGNANQWLKNAPAAGYQTGKIPMAGSAVVTSLSGKYGHVAYVEAVDAEKGTISISEMNYSGLGVITNRTLNIDDVVGFIYPKE